MKLRFKLWSRGFRRRKRMFPQLDLIWKRLRDEFIRQMFELNCKIRKFQESIAGKIHEEIYMEVEAGENCESRKSQESIAGKIHEENTMEIEAGGEGQELVRDDVSEVSLMALEEVLACVVSETDKVEAEYKSEQNIQKKVQQELVDCERKVFLMEKTLNATKELQDLTIYPFPRVHCLSNSIV